VNTRSGQLPGPGGAADYAFKADADGTIYPSGAPRSLPGLFTVNGETITPDVRPGGTDPNWTQVGDDTVPAAIPTGTPVIETPAGDIDGENTEFSLTAEPIELVLTQDGVILDEETDYTIDGTDITFETAPPLDSTLEATYWAP
jgi:hypothetical protein